MAATTAALKGALIFLGEVSKRRHLRDPRLQQVGSEFTSGFLNRSLFLWVNRTLVIGYRKVLDLEDLQQLGPEFSSTYLSDKFIAVWDKGKSIHLDFWDSTLCILTVLAVDKTSPRCLLKALLTVLAEPLFVSAIPRVCNVALEFIAPFYLKRIVEYVAEPNHPSDLGRGLIGATVLLFGGRAVSSPEKKSSTTHFLLNAYLCYN